MISLQECERKYNEDSNIMRDSSGDCLYESCHWPVLGRWSRLYQERCANRLVKYDMHGSPESFVESWNYYTEKKARREKAFSLRAYENLYVLLQHICHPPASNISDAGIGFTAVITFLSSVRLRPVQRQGGQSEHGRVMPKHTTYRHGSRT